MLGDSDSGHSPVNLEKDVEHSAKHEHLDVPDDPDAHLSDEERAVIVWTSTPSQQGLLAHC